LQNFFSETPELILRLKAALY